MIIYKEEVPNIESFFKLYRSTDWDKDENKQDQQLYDAAKKSWYMITAYLDNQIVGCGRIISDGYLHAFITELIILPESLVSTKKPQ